MGLSEGFKQNLEQADKTLDNNKNNDINSGELNYEKAVKKIENQYKNINSFLNTVEKGSQNEKYLNGMKNELDNLIEITNNELITEGGKLFSEITFTLNTHWDGIFEKDIKNTILEDELGKFNFVTVENGDTLSEIVKENYKITNYKEIESIIMQLLIKNPDLIKAGEILMLPNFNLLLDKFNNDKDLTEKDIIDFWKDFAGEDSNYQDIIPGDISYADVISFDNDGKINIDYNQIDKLNKLEHVNIMIEQTYESIIKSGNADKIFPKDCISKSDRLDFIQVTIVQKSQRVISTNHLTRFMVSDERKKYDETERNYVDDEKGPKSIYDSFSILDSIIDQFSESYKQQYEIQKIKNKASNEIISILAKGMNDNFGKPGQEVSPIEIEKYIYNNINENEYTKIIQKRFSYKVESKNLFKEIMNENNFTDIISKITNPNLSAEEIKNIEYDFINIMSDQLRASSSLYMESINSIPEKELNNLLPNNFDELTQIEYSKILEEKKKDGDNYTHINYQNIHMFRKFKVSQYFQNIEKNEIVDKSRVNDYVEHNILSKKYDLLSDAQNSSIDIIESQKEKELLNSMKKYGKQELEKILKPYKLDIDFFIDELNKNIGNTFLSNVGDFKNEINSKATRTNDFHMKIQHMGDFHKFGDNIRKITLNIGIGLKLFDDKRDIIKNNKKLTDDNLFSIREKIVNGILESSFIKSSISSLSNFHQDYIGDNEKDTKNHITNQLNLDKASNSEKRLFDTYSNINDSFNESFVISDNTTEIIVNGAVFVATSFISAGIGGLVGSTTGMARLFNSLLEIGSFTTMNLGYKKINTGEVTNQDIFFVMMMGGAITSATNIVGRAKDAGGKIINNKLYIQGRSIEGVNAGVAYGGSPERIMAHFMKVPGFKSKFGVINGGTSGQNLITGK